MTYTKKICISEKKAVLLPSEQTKDMKRGIVKLLIWLGIMMGLTMIAMIVWLLVFGGNSSAESLKWLQFLQTTATFLLPPVLCAWIWDERHQPLSWLKMDKKTDGSLFWIAAGIMVCAIPAINLLSNLNERIQLPESLDFIEQFMQEQEQKAGALTELFLNVDTIGGLIVNLGLMALLPALSEELSFRGTLQQILGNKHLAIWVTAILFSAIHMQFYGFIPRMLMGAMFGYIFVWSGSLWVPILMHFVNNGLAVLAAYFTADITADTKNWTDTIGAGPTWWLGVLSLTITCLGLLIFYRRTHKR